jgi:IMP dehydrogenase
MGVPQITALLEAARACKGTKVTFVADGGIRMMGDMAKALATGASAVMLGSMLAGHEQAPGEKVSHDGKTFKQYRGMGSIGAMQKGGAERYGQKAATAANKLVAEGVEGMVPFKGDVHEFHKKSQFIKITPAGMKESHPHSIKVVDAGGSYKV